MFPTCSKSALAGRKALSATDLTISPPGGLATRAAPPLRNVFHRGGWRHPQPSGGRGAPNGLRCGTRQVRPPMKRLAWYVPRALGERRYKRTADSRAVSADIGRASALTLTAAVALAACGGEPAPGRQRADRQLPGRGDEGQVPDRASASPRRPTCSLGVKNTGEKTIPELAVTIYTGTGTADRRRTARSTPGSTTRPGRTRTGRSGSSRTSTHACSAPAAPKTGDSLGAAAAAQTDTFGFGPLDPGETRDIVWRVTPVEGRHLHGPLQVAAGPRRQGQGRDRRRRPGQGRVRRHHHRQAAADQRRRRRQGRSRQRAAELRRPSRPCSASPC